MAIVLIEGFDHMEASAVTAKGWSGVPSSMQAGRLGGQCLRHTGAINKTLPSSYSTLIWGFAFRSSNTSSASNTFAVLRAGATNTVFVECNAAGKVEIKNSGGTVIATGTRVLSVDTWYYMEVKIVISGAAGSCELHINGVTDIAATTGNFGSTNLDVIRIIRGSVGNMDWDDMYCADTTGAAPRNTFLGDVRVDTVYPTSDGASSAWTPSTGSSHFALVDESSGTFPNGDTDYNSTSTVNAVDTFGMSAVAVGTGSVYGVQVNHYARKSDTTSRQIASVIRQGGTDYVGTTLPALSTTYAFASDIYNQDPTAADWTLSTAGADQYGVKLVV